MTWLAALNEAWNELSQTAPITRQYRSKLISTEVPLDVLAAIRAVDDAPCLMLQMTPSPDAFFELGGMRLSATSDDSGAFLVLSLEDSPQRDLFATICADVITAAVQTDGVDAIDRFLARLDAWRQFLRDKREVLSWTETIGIIGELLVLERLLTSNPRCLACWVSPNDGLHDFQRGGHALEVKTGLGPSPTITISMLDQLDTAGVRRLDLVHVRLVEAPDGRSLQDIIATVTTFLPDSPARADFENALLRRGLLPDDEIARNAPRVQLRSFDTYTVVEGFPRLNRATLPVAITDATYTLEVRAISAYSADPADVLDAFIQGARP